MLDKSYYDLDYQSLYRQSSAIPECQTQDRNLSAQQEMTAQLKI